MENLYQQLDKAETPEARASIAERIQAMSGRSAPERNLSNEFIIRKVPVYDGKGIMQGEQEEIVHLPTYLQQQQGGAAPGITMDRVRETAKAHGMTEQQVIEVLRQNGHQVR